LRVAERGRCDVLGLRVQCRPDRAVARICPRSPGAGEDLVGPPAEQEGVGALEDLAEERRGLVVVLEERQGPSAALESAPARLIPHDPTVEQQPRLPDLRRSGSYSVPFASASRDFGVLEPRYFDESGVPPDWKPGSRQVAFVVAHCGDLQIRLRQGRLNNRSRG